MSDLISSIIEICSSRNITQKELAEKSGLTESSISRYFNGERSPVLKNAEKMASALGLRIALINTGVINITESDDVCEWKQTSTAKYKTSCGYKLEEYFDTNACYCKQCGKKIKIVGE